MPSWRGTSEPAHARSPTAQGDDGEATPDQRLDIAKLAVVATEPKFAGGHLAGKGEPGQPLKNTVQFADYLLLMASSGARRNETLRLRLEDVDFERAQITIGADGLAKHHESRSVDFNPKLVDHLRAMRSRRAPGAGLALSLAATR